MALHRRLAFGLVLVLGVLVFSQPTLAQSDATTTTITTGLPNASTSEPAESSGSDTAVIIGGVVLVTAGGVFAAARMRKRPSR